MKTEVANNEKKTIRQEKSWVNVSEKFFLLIRRKSKTKSGETRWGQNATVETFTAPIKTRPFQSGS